MSDERDTKIPNQTLPSEPKAGTPGGTPHGPEETARPAPGQTAAEEAAPGAARAELPDQTAEADEDKPIPRKHRRHDHDPVLAIKDKLERREHEIEHLRRELAESRDKYLRLAAEMENSRKRLDREKAEYLQFAQAELYKELLAVLDNFERARMTGEDPEGKGFQEGIELIHKQFTDLLRKRGVAPIMRTDRKFDPAVHQAILTEEKEGLTEAEVGEELQKGYTLYDRLLRPALVKVSVPKKD
jgi:molecular chaperone GrpE